jgi:hypothetical protein
MLLGLTGTSFADETQSISSDDGSATVSAKLIGLSGNGVELHASDISVTDGCIYIKYSVKVDHWRDKHGEHIGSDPNPRVARAVAG